MHKFRDGNGNITTNIKEILRLMRTYFRDCTQSDWKLEGMDTFLDIYQIQMFAQDQIDQIEAAINFYNPKCPLSDFLAIFFRTL